MGVTSFGALARPGPALGRGGLPRLVRCDELALGSTLDGALTAAGPSEKAALREIVLTCLAITWLNPHVYLDTVFLIGAISTQFPSSEASFTAGAITGSFAFFLSLGYGAKRLRPIFAKPSAWRALEAVIALVMWSISLRLVSGA